MQVRQLQHDDVEAVIQLRAEAISTHPLSFGSSPLDDRLRSADFIRAVMSDENHSAIFGAEDSEGLVGIVGINQILREKRKHKAEIWAMYVAPRARGMGVGRRLISAAIHHAFQWDDVEQIQLCVTSAADNANRLYQSLGFKPWGTEPKSLKWEGEYADQVNMVLLKSDWTNLTDAGWSIEYRS